MKNPFIKPRLIWALCLFFILGLLNMAMSQTPTVTVRFANPVYSCVTSQYCLDVEFLSDMEDVEVFGMNVRFFYDDMIMELDNFTDFQGGYGPVSPDPPTVTQSPPGVGFDLFGFGDPGTGVADFVNGAIQLVDDMQPAIILSTTEWTKLFQVCFIVENPGLDSSNFCPPVVWDLEANPLNGGFLIGDDGVVITITDPDPNVMSQPAFENVVQFNWQYTGDGTPPYGEPVEEICISLECIPSIVCPGDITIECFESTDPAFTGTATAEVICMADITISYTDVTLEGECANAYTITRTWVAINECNESDTCDQIIQIVDTTSPLIFCPSDVTIECDESTLPANTGTALATDLCDLNPIISYTDVTLAGDCAQAYSIERTWVAIDACGNSSTCLQNITIEDTTPPVITFCPPTIVIECDESTLPVNTGEAMATDNCDPAPVVDYFDVTFAGQTCEAEYLIVRTWTATDACGNSTACQQTIIVDDSTPPFFTLCPPDMTIECDESTLPDHTGLASATDNCDLAPVVEYADVTFTFEECQQAYFISRLWTATDACGNSSSCFQSITIIDSTPPVLDCAGDITIECNTDTSPESTGFSSATDNCTSEPLVDYQDVTLAGECAQAYTIERTWTAWDDCGNSSTCLQVISIIDSTSPTLSCPDDVTIECDDTTSPDGTGFASATDNCDPQPQVDYDDVTINDACPQIIERTWTATDACGNTSQCIQLITIQDTNPPSIICPPAITVTCDMDVPDPDISLVTSSDICGDVVITHEEDIISNQTCLNRYVISRVYASTDVCGNSATCIQTITVFDDQAPMLTCPANVTVSCASEVPPVNTGSVTTTDNCAGAVTVTHDGDVTTGMTCANRFTLFRTYRATDVCGNSATCTQIITVFDGTPPTLTCPANVTVSCANQVPAPNVNSVTTSDNCGGVVTVVHVGDVTTNMTCVNRFTVSRTYQATDVCGNSAFCTQVITVFDSTPPMVTCPPNITIMFGDSEEPGNTGTPTASDNCGGTPELGFEDTIIPGPCDEEYTIERLWTAVDECGNEATCVQVIFVDGFCIIDLALTKTLVGPLVVYPGNNVLFAITITNEGEVTIGSVTITDYIPLGFSLDDGGWIPGNQGSTGQSAMRTISVANGQLPPTGLLPGASVTIYISLIANLDVQPGIYFNTAEISSMLDMNGVDVSDQDIDSTPDTDDTNDPPGEDDIDSAQICVLPVVVISGDNYVCPGQVETYFVTPYNPDWTYVWTINGGGVIIEDNGSSITVQWGQAPGGPYLVTVNVILGSGCQTSGFRFVYIQGQDAIACNDHIQISLGPDCQAVVLSGMILEGEAEGNNNYYVIVTDQNGNVIPNATLTHEHIGQTFTVMVVNECNGQSCWGTISVEDKIPPTIECRDVEVMCGEPFPTGPAPSIVGYQTQILTGLNDLLEFNTLEYTFDYSYLPSTPVLDVDVRIQIDDHTWLPDVKIEVESPNGTIVDIFDISGCIFQEWPINCIFDDNGGVITLCADLNAGPNGRLQPLLPPGVSMPNLFNFNGLDASGVWTVRISDIFNADDGHVREVGLYINVNLPQVDPFDNCSDVHLTYTDTESGDPCEDLVVSRTWVATDDSGNSSSCVQRITVTPLVIDSVRFPAPYVGECGESIHPNNTGWPTVNGTPITDLENLCNIFTGYWDKELIECGGGRKIVRTWTVLDWCALEVVDAIQVIKLSDSVGPELVCPSNIQVGTDFWYCYANVSVPRPTASDVCSEIASYQLHSNAGVIVSFGNNYVINQLPLGAHIVTWTVWDECGNSSTCTFTITVVDDVAPAALCDQHTVVSLTNDGPRGVTLVPAEVFDDGSYDNCGPVTFLVSRMTPPNSCINFDWTTNGACIDDIPNGQVNSRDQGTVPRPCVPFACCDVGAGPVMVILEVTDASGNKNFCMVEAIVQDKIPPFIICPPDIIVSCDFWFNVVTGTFVDASGNNNGNLDEDPLTPIFGNVFNAFAYNDDESVRQDIIINDPGNTAFPQPRNWGRDGWADDNCDVTLQVTVSVIDDCSGDDLPANAPAGAVKLITRVFRASDGNQGVAPGSCTQRIWVVDYDPFIITDTQCGLVNADDVRWPCDILLTDCPQGGLTPDDLVTILPMIQRINARPVVNDDACSLIGVTYEDTRFDFVDGACFKILRRWSVIDWCQYNAQTGAGLWHYTQVIKVHDEQEPIFVAPCVTQVLCVADPGVSLPDNNQVFLGEGNPLASSCSVHLSQSRVVTETCSDFVQYDVKIYPFNGTEFILIKPTTTAPVDENGQAVLSFDTRESTIQAIRLNGLPYNSPWCGDYHRILWSVEDGCGNWGHCEYLVRLEDCKQPSPVCINGLSTVLMPIGGQVTIWAKDFNASSFDDCTPAAELLYSFSGDTYMPSFTYTCENVPAFNTELAVQIWVADGGTDDNCNNQISWVERNKDFCTTTIVITDNNQVCGGSGSILAGGFLTDNIEAVSQVGVTLTSPGHFFPQYVTAQDGKYAFFNVPLNGDYTITPQRNDQHRNGVSTLDLVRIQKHLLGIEPFTSPYQFVAADANKSNSVSAVDLVEIRKLILGIYAEFPLNTSWRFVEKESPMTSDQPWTFHERIEITNLSQDSLMYNDFVGVKIGDVNNSAKANLNQLQPRSGRRIMDVAVEGPATIEKGQLITVRFMMPEQVDGFQWTLETEGLVLDGIEGEAIRLNDSHIGVLGDGVVTMSWNAELPGTGTSVQMFTLRFNATAAGKLSDMIRLSSRVTEAEAYPVDGDVLDVRLTFGDETSEFALYQNEPNPWNGRTTIGFVIPHDDKVKLSVLDAVGKTLSVIEGEFKAGYNTIEVSSTQFLSTGVMYYRLESGAYTASKKMVLLQ